jgi:hypothetical protein
MTALPEERLRFSGAEVVIRASADTTSGAFSIIEEIARLAMLSPAGFEGFFSELSEAEREGTLGPEAHARASKRYGITWIT